MKDSGVDWLGNVPLDWGVMRLKHALSRNDGGVWGKDPTGNGDTIVLRSTEQTADGRWLLADPAYRSLSASEKASATLEEGDLLVTKSSGSSLHIGKTTLVDAEVSSMKCCYSNFMQRLRTNERLTPRLAWYVLNNDLARQQFDLSSNSTTGLANLNSTLLGDIWITVPRVEEQATLVDHLDRATTRIDALVTKKARFIELLREKRQAMITHAVTKGLDRGVQMKESGVEWLGEVPADWKVIALKRLGRLKGGNGFPPGLQGRPDNELPFFKVSDLGKSADGQHLSAGENTITPDEAADLGATIFPADALAWAKIGAALSLNRRRIITKPSCLDNNMTGFIPDSAVVSTRFSFYLMSAVDFTVHAKPGAVPSFSEGDQGELSVSLPPAASQQAIVDHLDRATARIDTLIAKTERSIELLREHRTALITAAVTGKIDLRPTA